MFFKARREAREKAEQETLRIEDEKLATRLEKMASIPDIAERYLGLKSFQASMDGNRKALDEEFKSRVKTRQFNVALLASTPVVALAVMISGPVAFTAAALGKAGIAAIMGFTPSLQISQLFKDTKIGHKKVAAEMLAQYQRIEKYRGLAESATADIVANHIVELAQSPQSQEILKVSPELGTAMVAAFNSIAAKQKAENPAPAQNAKPSGTKFNL